jgi:hypothetical protein
VGQAVTDARGSGHDDVREAQPDLRSRESGERTIMRRNTLRKQITVLVPVEDWRVMRDEAARRGMAVTELCRATLEPLIDELRRSSGAPSSLHPGRCDEDAFGETGSDPDENPRPRPARNPPDHPWRRT